MSNVAIGDTLPQHLARQAAARGADVALREKRRGAWRRFTWAEIRDEVIEVAHGLTQLGFLPGESLALVGDATRPLLAAASAVQLLRGVPVPLGQLPDDALGAILARANVRYALAADDESAERLSAVSPPGRPMHMLACHGHPTGARPTVDVHGYEAVRSLGRERARSTPRALDTWLSAGTSGDHALAAWTADRAGAVRKRVIDHRQLLATPVALREAVGARDEALIDDALEVTSASLFAWAHWQVSGFRLSCGEHRDSLDHDRRELRPTYLVSTARGYEGLHARALAQLPSAPGLQRRIVDWGLETAQRPAGPTFLARATVQGPLRQRLGLARVRRAAVVGKAPKPEAQRFFAALGIVLAPLRAVGGEAPRAAAVEQANEASPVFAVDPWMAAP